MRYTARWLVVGRWLVGLALSSSLTLFSSFVLFSSLTLFSLGVFQINTLPIWGVFHHALWISYFVAKLIELCNFDELAESTISDHLAN